MHLISGSTIPDITDAGNGRDGKLCKFFLYIRYILQSASFQEYFLINKGHLVPEIDSYGLSTL